MCTKAMVILKGTYRCGDLKNVLLLLVQKQYLPVRGRKLPRFMGGSIGPRMEIFKISGLQIPIVPHLHQSNGYIKRKQGVWRAHKCIALVGADTVLTRRSRKVPCFMRGSIWPEMEICETSGLQIPWYRVCTKAMVISKRSYWYGELKNVLL